MKKLLSLILCLLLVVSLTVPVLATDSEWEFEMDIAEQAEETAPEIYYFSASGEEFIFDEDNAYTIIGEDGVAVEKVIPYDEFYGVIDGEQATLVAPATGVSSRLPAAIILLISLVVLIGLLLLIVAAVVIVLIVVLVRKKKKNKAEEPPSNTSEE